MSSFMKKEKFEELFSKYAQEYCDNIDGWEFAPFSNMFDYINLKMLYSLGETEK